MTDRSASALHDSELSIRLFVEGVSDYAVFMLDLEGLVAGWNTGAKAIKGYDTAEILGRHFSCLHARGYCPPASGTLAEAGQGSWTLRGDRAWQRKGDGSFSRHTSSSARSTMTTGLVGYGKITRDISERVKAAEKLRTSDARLRSMVDTLLETLVTV